MPRELMAKLRSMTETIKMLSTENVALREENDGLVMMRGGNSGSLNGCLYYPSLWTWLHLIAEYKLVWFCCWTFLQLLQSWWCFL